MVRLESLARRGIACAMLFAAGSQLPGDPANAQVARTAEVPAFMTNRPADAANGRRIIVDRRRGMCLLCHSGPFPEERFQGNLAPSLAGAGTRWNEGQLRFRLIDSARINAQTIMPPYFRAEGLNRVGSGVAGRTILTAEEIEDVIAFLATLRE